jgi:hypothetical protein
MSLTLESINITLLTQDIKVVDQIKMAKDILYYKDLGLSLSELIELINTHY